jgi:hypothetical protein
MRLQAKKDSFIAQKEFLHTTQGVLYKVGGGTLKASAFTPDATGHVKAGSGVRLNAGDGLFYPHDNGVTAGRLYVTAHDVYITDGDAVVGLLEEGYLNSSVVGTVETGRVAITGTFTAHANAENRYKLR